RAEIVERQLGDRLGDGVTGEVHEVLRQQDAHLLRTGFAAQPAPAEAPAVRGRVDAEAAVRGEALGHAPAHVVTRARVARTGLAEADDELHLVARPGYSSFFPPSFFAGAPSPSAGAAASPSAVAAAPSAAAASAATSSSAFAGITTDTTPSPGSDTSVMPS